jgi:hypothetical protein
LCHRARHRAHRDGGLDAGGDGVDARGQREQLDALLGVADRVGGVEARDLRLRRGGGQGFFQFGLLGAAVFVGFGGLAV